jgi:hypothetical protein
MSVETKYIPRLYKKYKEEVVPKLSGPIWVQKPYGSTQAGKDSGQYGRG